MTIPLRVLILEDRPTDAELIVYELRQAGFEPDWQRVDTEADYLAHLDPALDIILADYALPQWDAPHALRALQERGLDIPFIMISATVGEDIAVECIKQGAVDYLLKDRLGRLGMAVTKALEDKRLRVEKRRAEAALRESEEKFRNLFNNAEVGMFRTRLDGSEILDANEKFLRIFGRTREEMQGLPSVIHWADPREREEMVRRLEAEGHIADFECKMLNKQGQVRICLTSLKLFPEQGILEGSILDITERKQAEEDLHKLSQAVEHSPSIVYITDSDGRLEYVNPKFTEITGYMAEEAADQLPRLLDPDLISPEEYEERWATIHSGKEWRGEFQRRKKNGELFWELASISSIKDEAGAISHLVIVIEDITERKRTEEALIGSEKRLRTVLENMPVMLDALDEDLNIIFWNRECERVTGYTADDVIHHPRVSELLYPDPAYRERMQAELVTRGDYRNWEWEVTCKDGSVRTISWSNISRQHPIPGWAHWGIGVDITELKRAERAERSARILAQALAETGSALTRVLNLDAVMNTILQNVARVVPHDAANIMLIEGDQARVAYWQGYRPDSIAFLQEFSVPLTGTRHLERMLATQSPFLVAHTDQHPDWVRRVHTEWVKSYVAAPIRSHGTVIGFLNVDSAVPGFFTEDHARRLQSFADQASLAIEHAQLYEEIRRRAIELEQRVEERTAQLNHAKERIEAILNSSNDVMILCRSDSTIDQTNPAFYETFGYTPDEIFDQPLTELVVPDQARLLGETFETIVQIREPRRLEVSARYRESTPFDADMVLSPVVGSDDHLFGVIVSLRDISRRKQMEAQLRKMLEHEMELGELKSRYISMAAHDLRNPLAVIRSAVDLIQQYSDRLTNEQQQKKYSDIQASIAVMVSLLDDILTIGQVESGKLTFNPTPLDVVTFCRNLSIEMSQVAGGAHRIVFSSQGDCHNGLVDAKLLRHILGNLLSNAIKYSREAGDVIFDVDCQPDQITFRVQDHGIGIPEADQKRLFETFHRASNVRQIPGTGLGLAIVKQSVELHGGTVSFESEEGVGTTFSVVLPQADRAAGRRGTGQMKPG